MALLLEKNSKENAAKAASSLSTPTAVSSKVVNGSEKKNNHSPAQAYAFLQKASELFTQIDQDSKKIAGNKESKKSKTIAIPEAKIEEKEKNIDPTKLLVETILLIQELQVILTRNDEKNTDGLAKMGDITQKEIKIQTQKLVDHIEKLAKLEEKQKKEGKALTAISDILQYGGLVLAALMGPGVLLAATLLLTLQKTGAMDKLTNVLTDQCHMSPIAAKILVVATVTAAGAGVAAAGESMFSGIGSAASDATVGAAEMSTEEGSSAAAGSTAEQAEAGAASRAGKMAKMGAMIAGTQSIVQTNILHNFTEAVFKDKKTADILAGVLDVVVALAGMIAAGKMGGLTEMNSSRYSSFMDKSILGMGVAQGGLTSASGAMNIAQGTTLMEIAKVLKEKGSNQKDLSLLKWSSKMNSTQMKRERSLLTSLIKAISSEIRSIETVVQPQVTAANVLSSQSA